jgi:uncharacterized protein YkwD
MSAQRSAIACGLAAVGSAAVVTLLVGQWADGSMPSTSPAADVTVVDVRRAPEPTEAITVAPDSVAIPSAAAPPSTTATTMLATTTVPVTTAVVDRAAAGPAEAGVVAPVRGEQIQLTEPVPAPATTTTTTTTEPPPPTQLPAGPAPQPPASQATPPSPTPAPSPTPPPTQPPPPPPTAPPPPPPPPPASTSSDAVALTNQERANAGLSPLNANGALNTAAAVHSADQAARNQMTHTGSDGSNAGGRISAAGYQPGTWGENVAAGYSSASSVVAGWMGSSGHRANILNPAFTQIGVASATAADGTRYWTMVLAG